MEHFSWLVGTTLLNLIVTGFLGAYLKKKGETWASKEDIKEVIAQTSAITQVTEDIKARISNEYVDRQKRWDLKREILFETIRELAKVESAFRHFTSAHGITAENETQVGILGEKQTEAGDKLNEALSSFWAARNLAAIVCSQAIMGRFNDIVTSVSAASYAMQQNPPAKKEPLLLKLVFDIQALLESVGDELGFRLSP